jgi:hypothetical protein
MNHAVVTATTCKTCHVATYVSSGLLTKPGNHIPESAQLLGGATLDCKACHTSTTNWATQRMNHNSTMGNGAGWCKGCHQNGTNYGGNMDKEALTHERVSPAPTDCSQSGCHKPLGGKGSSWTKWD